jgi:hypothetical protein
MNLRIAELLEADRFDVDDVLEKYENDWTTEDYKWFFQEFENLETHGPNLKAGMNHAILNIDDSQFILDTILSGKYGAPVIKRALMNPNCPNEVAEKLYCEPRKSNVWAGMIQESLIEYGKDYFDNYSNQINAQIEEDFANLDLDAIKASKELT